jgi:hypothetical protein
MIEIRVSIEHDVGWAPELGEGDKVSYHCTESKHDFLVLFVFCTDFV